MKKQLLIMACSLALLIHARTVKGFQQTKLQDELNAWAEQATPVEPTATQSDYDPSKVAADKIETMELMVKDKTRARDIQ